MGITIPNLDVVKFKVYDTDEAHNASDPHPRDFICVYGTLRRHLGDETERGWNSDLMAPVLDHYQGAVSLDRLAMYSGIRTVPYVAITHDKADRVVLERYSLRHLTGNQRRLFMSYLDRLEGAPGWYRRTRALASDGEYYWFYSQPAEACAGRRRHPTGDWAYTGEAA